jgi:hypothetical protein
MRGERSRNFYIHRTLQLPIVWSAKRDFVEPYAFSAGRLLAVGVGDLAETLSPRHGYGPVDLAGFRLRIIVENLHYEGRVACGNCMSRSITDMIADAVVRLFSGESLCYTGQALILDGGAPWPNRTISQGPSSRSSPLCGRSYTLEPSIPIAL